MKRPATPSSSYGPIPPSKAARTASIDSIAASCQEIVNQLPNPSSHLPATTAPPSSTIKHGIRAILSHLLGNPTTSEPISTLAVNLFRSLPSWRDSQTFHFASPPVEVWNLLMRSNRLELLYQVLSSLPPPSPALQTLVDNLQRLWTDAQQVQGPDMQHTVFRITFVVLQRNSGIKAVLDRPATFQALCHYLTQFFAASPANSSTASDILSAISLLVRHAQQASSQAPALSPSLDSPPFVRSLHRFLAGRAHSLNEDVPANHAHHASALGRCLALCKQLQPRWTDSLVDDAASSFVRDLCTLGSVLFPTSPINPGGHGLFRPLFLPFLQVLASLLSKSTNGLLLVRDSGLIPQLMWLFSTLLLDPTTNQLPHDDDMECDDSQFASSTLYLADYDLAVQLARVLAHLCQYAAIGPPAIVAAPKSAINLFARRLVDSVCLPVASNPPPSPPTQPGAAAPPVIVVRRSSTAPPREHKRALFSKCLKLLSVLLGKWEVSTPIIQHGLVPLVRRLTRYPHEQEVVPDATEVYLCCLCTRHLAESSLLRLRVRDSAELTQLWSTMVGNLANYTLERGSSVAVSASAVKQLAIAVDHFRSDARLIDPLSGAISSVVATHFRGYMTRTPCLPADADLEQHQPLASLLLSVSHGPSLSRTPDIAVQLMPSLIRVPRFATRLVSLWFQRSPNPLDFLIQLVTSVISLNVQLVIGSRTDWISRILGAFHSQVAPSKRANWLSSVVAFWIQARGEPQFSNGTAHTVPLVRVANLAQLYDPGSIVGFALIADLWLSRPYRDPIPTSDMWARFAHGCIHQAQDDHLAPIVCADGITVLVCSSCFANASGYFAGLFLDGFLESSTLANLQSGPAGVVTMDWLPADLLRDTVDFAFSGKTAGQWWPSEDSDVHGRVHSLVEMVLLADRLVAPTIQLACLELLFACLNPTSRFVAERFPIATPPARATPVGASAAGSYPSAWSPLHAGASGGAGYEQELTTPSYSPSPPGSPMSVPDESALLSPTSNAVAASEPAMHQVEPQVAQRSRFVGQAARAILEAYVSVTLEGWPAESCRVFQPLLLEAVAQLLVRYPVTLDHVARREGVDPFASSSHFDTLLLELCNRLVDLVV